MRAVLAPAITPVSEGGLGYRAVVLNSRGCAGVPLTSPALYCAGRTTDLRSALLYLQTLYPSAPLIGVGFSLGSSVLTKYLGEEGEESRLTSGLGVGVVCTLQASALYASKPASTALGLAADE